VSVSVSVSVCVCVREREREREYWIDQVKQTDVYVRMFYMDVCMYDIYIYIYIYVYIYLTKACTN
jgi:hypothetical protein